LFLAGSSLRVQQKKHRNLNFPLVLTKNNKVENSLITTFIESFDGAAEQFFVSVTKPLYANNVEAELDINTLLRIPKSVDTKGLIIWSLLSRRLVVVAKPNIGHLASASEVAGRHTLPF
jgi:hypothetical protein